MDSKGFHSPTFFLFSLNNEELEGSEEVIKVGIGILLLSEPLSTGTDRRRRFVEILGFIFGHMVF
jgi:hypothetical protein